MKSVYVLKLKNGMIYVGITNKDVMERFEEHVRGDGSEWTKLHEPIKIIEVLKNADPFDEDKYTKIYMNKYGIDKVRGGSYCTIKLPEYKIKSLSSELNNSNSTCFICSSQGHYAKDCPENKSKKRGNKKITNLFCKTCGRNSHNAENCYAKHDLDGKVIKKTNTNKTRNKTTNKTYKKKKNDADECIVS